MRDKIVQKVASLRFLPTVDPIVMKTLAILSNPDCSFRDLLKVIKYDNAITSKIINIANSAFYSRGVEILSLERAMTIIGLEEIRHILTCMVFLNRLLKHERIKEEDLLTFWRHSLFVACASSKVCSKTLIDHPDKVFTLSLLHDIGKLVFYVTVDGYGDLVKEAQRDGIESFLLERERLGIDHQETGLYLAKKWKFPSDLLKVVSQHHERESKDPIINLINLCDRYFHFPYSFLGDLGLILLNSKDEIEEEVKKIEKILEVKS